MRRPARPGPKRAAAARPPADQKSDGEVIYGLRAGLAVHARRPGDILRVAFAPSVRGDIGEL
nr:hypothetical protein [Myxococcota bacterium]